MPDSNKEIRFLVDNGDPRQVGELTGTLFVICHVFIHDSHIKITGHQERLVGDDDVAHTTAIIDGILVWAMIKGSKDDSNPD